MDRPKPKKIYRVQKENEPMNGTGVFVSEFLPDGTEVITMSRAAFKSASAAADEALRNLEPDPMPEDLQ